MDESLPVSAIQPATDQLTLLEAHVSAGGSYRRYQHWSITLQCTMTFGVFLPPQLVDMPCPIIWWLSGLTCTDENFMQKAGAHRAAAQRGVVLVCPDTSPRGTKTPGEDDNNGLGTGAGFYLNATQPPWCHHYRMYDYVTEELPSLLRANFAVSRQASIMGHSMGGLGALICGLRLPERYAAISAFAPLVHPSRAPWGQVAFQAYLGDDQHGWETFDPCRWMSNLSTIDDPLPILIDQGTQDPFLHSQLCPEDFAAACRARDYPLTLRYQPGYDHSYFFVASFIEEHLDYHADALWKRDRSH